MTELYRYQPVMIPGPTGTDYRPSADGLTDLAELDGWRYVAVPEGVVPDVPEALTTWEPVTLTTELRESIKLASPHAQLIAQQVIDRIRAQYPMTRNCISPASPWAPCKAAIPCWRAKQTRWHSIRPMWKRRASGVGWRGRSWACERL